MVQGSSIFFFFWKKIHENARNFRSRNVTFSRCIFFITLLTLQKLIENSIFLSRIIWNTVSAWRRMYRNNPTFIG